jgi:RimJ/RimL family protein N-acetyltransferase
MTNTDPVSNLPIGRKVEGGPAKRPTRTTLYGRYVTVRPLDSAADAQTLYEGTHGPDKYGFWRYMSAGPFSDLRTFQDYLDKRARSEDPLSFSVVDKETNDAVGHASFMRITPDHRVIEVGNIFYTSLLARKRGATEAMYLMARHIFEDLGYRRYEWKCDALNLPSRRAALRLGFSYEGLFLQHMIQQGRNRDTAWFSMLDSEWPSYKIAYEQWLAPENFDQSGVEMRGLNTYLQHLR